MQKQADNVVLSPSDLVGFMYCEHLTHLELDVINNALKRPVRDDADLAVITNRGLSHEARYLSTLRANGKSIIEIEVDSSTDLYGAEALTLDAMKKGVDVVYQATFFDGTWRGHADFLLRVETPSNLGSWSYEVADTKLARHVKVGALMQMCNYSEHVARLQGEQPITMHVVLGDNTVETWALDDMLAYYHSAKSRFERAITEGMQATYPNPVAHCDVCAWVDICKAKRKDDDHLSLIAGMRSTQITRFAAAGTRTVADLVASDEGRFVKGIGLTTVQRLRQQAMLQVAQRKSSSPSWDLLIPEGPMRGLAILPEPSPGDIFLDLEGDPYEGARGIEYLIGAVEVDTGKPEYRSWWAHTAAEEKRAFEAFMDYAIDRLAKYPDLHIYHYAPYEQTAFKRLMGTYATREAELDRLLRGKVFVDLYQIVRQSLRISQDSYSIKKLEPFYMDARDTVVVGGGASIAAYEQWLAEGNQSILDDLENYNKDDCVSTYLLRKWLEDRRIEFAAKFNIEIERPELESGDPSEKVDVVDKETERLHDLLTAGLNEVASERTPEEHVRWLLAQLLGWHRRENKPEWWSYFYRCSLNDEELVNDSDAIGAMSYVGQTGTIKKSVIERYSFDPEQEFKISVGDTPRDPATGGAAGEVLHVDSVRGFIELKRGPSSTTHPSALIPQSPIGYTVLAQAVARVAESMCTQDVVEDNNYRAIMDLLFGRAPQLRAGLSVGDVQHRQNNGAEAAREIVAAMNGGALAIQGPPGTGKTHTGAQLILDCVAQHRTVGVTASSHKVISNLLFKLCEQAEERGVEIRVMQKVSSDADLCAHRFVERAENVDIERCLADNTVDVVAGTQWLFSRSQLDALVDTLVIDEAGQMSLANAVAAATSAKNVILLGDPQQLSQPSKGSHPPGSSRSALKHLLGNHETLPIELGVFLATTYRMHPDVCSFISERFYDKRLFSVEACALQKLSGDDGLSGSGLRFVPVQHKGNRNSSQEESNRINELVAGLVGRTWTSRGGTQRPITIDDILVVAPYNAQVANLGATLPEGMRIGTVDKFQGQEAPVVIYSMAASSSSEVPRGIEFLYDTHRFNVAISRAQGLAIVVCSPQLLNAHCHRPQQLKLLNALCCFVESSDKKL